MSKCKINCFSHMFDHREWEITSDGRVWAMLCVRKPLGLAWR